MLKAAGVTGLLVVAGFAGLLFLLGKLLASQKEKGIHMDYGRPTKGMKS
jgi:hypothetical protein